MKPLIFSIVAMTTAPVIADPQLTSWFTANSGKYARIYPTSSAQTSQTTSTTWSRGSGTQTYPAYAGVHEINYSANYIYVRTTGLASHVMGPWYLDAAKSSLFPNYPSNTAVVYKIPRTSTLGTPPATKTLTGNGAIGYFVNGVAFFDNRDAFSYKNSSATDATPTNGLTGDGIWNRNAYANELVTFDAALAHQAGNQYHYHVNPIALRYQMNDHVTYNSAANTYAEATSAAAHSPILAWAADGYPVYGPYGYSDPTNASSAVRRIVSGYVARNGSYGTTNLSVTGRTTLPAWAATAQSRSATLTSTQYGPGVNTTYPLGHYIEDYDHLGDHGYTQTTGATVRDFDLDKYNGRFCVTPEFPNGTYAYFSTLDASNAPAFPYNIGRQFYGNVTGGTSNTTAMNADTPLTRQFLGGANTAIAINTPTVSGTSVTITWSATEGGTYTVDASPNQSTWTSKATGISVTNATTGTSTYTAVGTSGTEYGRVTRTALATYDTNGTTTATVSQTATASYVIPAPAMTVTAAANLTASGPAGGPFSPSSTTYTVTNSGTGTLTWGVSKNVAWLDLSATGGTLGAGANTTVTVSLNNTANTLGSGAFSDTLTFTNSSNGNGTTTRPVNLSVLSTNANLAALTLGGGTLSPAFSSIVATYTATVSNSTSTITVTPTSQDAGASITVNGAAVVSGTASGALALVVGDNVLSIVVTPQSGPPASTYTVTVTRQSTLQGWRQTWYGTAGSSGDAADLADPYHTGYSNLAVFAFFGPGQNPATAGSLQLPQPMLSGGYFIYQFTQPAGVSGVTYGAQWSATIQPNDWHTITDTGSGSQHVFSIPAAASGQTFMRLQVSSP